MSFVKTLLADLLAAQGQLTSVNSNLEAQNAGAASATTVVSPAASDPVSIQQAALFSAYGTQYQTLAAQAQTQLQQYAANLGVSSNSYGDTESTNAAANTISSAVSNASSSSSSTGGSTIGDLIEDLANFLGNNSATGLSSSFSNILNIGGGNWASAASDLLGLAGGGLLDTSADAAGAGLAADVAASPGLGATGAAAGGMVGMGGMPVASMGSATMVSSLAVPPSWAGVAPVASAVTPVQTVGWTAAAPQAGVGTVVPGMPGMAAGARSSAGFGAPRYGVKPIVMPKPKAI
ncbi:PPE family protein, SVP subgroup [Mycobacterium sp. M23085]|uniref:PPE family protein, SVP subgroup n=1 Tax=Mycobacterium sp. M23085 TaxID=3378087 RepID=UPI003877F35C